MTLQPTDDNQIKFPKVGEIIEGKILAKKSSAVYLDLGIFGAGIIFGKEFQDAKNVLKSLGIGDTVFAKIVDLENEEGYIELSLEQADKEISWKTLREKKDNDEIVAVKILGVNKGGLLAEISGIPAFLPVSQLSPANYPKVEGADKMKILKELQKFVGKEMEVKIFDVDPMQNKLILSEKAKETKKIREMLSKFSVGDIIEGEITGIVDFGAFIKFPHGAEPNEMLEGLIHISELDWQLIENPANIVKVGEIVKAKIIDIKEDKVFLSLKALKEDPWKNIEEHCKKGEVVRGKVTKINPFGAFIQIKNLAIDKAKGKIAVDAATPNIQGLCHISEFGNRAKMETELKIGEEYDFKIVLIEPTDHRMHLKLATNREEEACETAAAVRE